MASEPEAACSAGTAAVPSNADAVGPSNLVHALRDDEPFDAIVGAVSSDLTALQLSLDRMLRQSFTDGCSILADGRQAGREVGVLGTAEPRERERERERAQRERERRASVRLRQEARDRTEDAIREEDEALCRSIRQLQSEVSDITAVARAASDDYEQQAARGPPHVEAAARDWRVGRAPPRRGGASHTSHYAALSP